MNEPLDSTGKPWPASSTRPASTWKRRALVSITVAGGMISLYLAAKLYGLATGWWWW